MKLTLLFIATLALLAAGCMEGGAIDSTMTNILGQ
jgi:hypothetical protein|tara:strand:+ start:518 stop:622 length:105 start_codon:yes stop_codon:yes gene_type:complete